MKVITERPVRRRELDEVVIIERRTQRQKKMERKLRRLEAQLRRQMA